MAPSWRRSPHVTGWSTWAAVAVSGVLSIALGTVLSSISSLPFWGTVAIAAASIVLNGAAATIEDQLPGGFNNSDGATTPRLLARVARMVQILSVAVLLVMGAAFVHLGTASGRPGGVVLGGGLGGCSCCMALLLVYRRRWALYAAVGCLAGAFVLSTLVAALAEIG